MQTIHYCEWAALAVGLFGLITSTVFLGLVVAGVVRFRREAQAQVDSHAESQAEPQAEPQTEPQSQEADSPSGLPGTMDWRPKVSLLKPLHGAEPGLEENLRGFFEQDYFSPSTGSGDGAEVRGARAGLHVVAQPRPAYEILFCARRIDDAGLQVAAKVAAKYPHVPARIVTSGEPWAANAKVCSLVKMAEVAAYDIWVISDSDVRVGPDYLRAVVSPFRDEAVGAVTCLYRGVAAEDEPAGGDSAGAERAGHAAPMHAGGKAHVLWSRLEAVGMSIEMSSGVLVANLLEGMQFVLGPTMAVRRECVDAMGGFGVMGQYCADDFVLGSRVAAQGRKVVLSGYAIDHIVLNESFVDSVKHQVRWMKSTRMSRPKGHFGTSLTFGTPFGLLALLGACLLGMPWLGAAAFALSVLGRMTQSLVVGRYVVRERALWRTVLLFPVRDLMGFFFWALSYTSRKIVWRGELYELGPEGVMRAAKSPEGGR